MRNSQTTPLEKILTTIGAASVNFLQEDEPILNKCPRGQSNFSIYKFNFMKDQEQSPYVHLPW